MSLSIPVENRANLRLKIRQLAAGFGRQPSGTTAAGGSGSPAFLLSFNR